MRTATHAPSVLREFVKLHPEVEGVLQRVGLRTFDLVLADVQGSWIHHVVASAEEAEAICRDLGIRLNEGWDDPRLARRLACFDRWNRVRRST